MPYGVQDLSNVLDRVPAKSQQFAADLVRKAPRGLSDKQLYWVDKLASEALNPTPMPASVTVGDMSGVIALFDRARAHLKFPAIVLSCPGTDVLRVNVAGPSAQFPGSLNVTSYERFENNRRRWFGRVHRDGRFDPSPKQTAVTGVIATRLREFSTAPARIAAEHGRLTGRCCFCNRALEDERSTTVGYGPVCAGHYGLPWGEV